MLLLEACQRTLEDALSLVENIRIFFEDCFAMQDVTVYAARKVGKKT